MIIKTSNIDELNRIVRASLIQQSELDSNRIVNGVSIHGQELLEKLNKYAYKSYDPDDAFIVFELQGRDSSSNVSQTTEDNTISYYMSYGIHVIVYGNGSPTLSNIICSRFRTAEVRDNLQYQGIYIESIENPRIGNDFVNSSLYMRCDFFINISCQMQISQVKQDEIFDKIDITMENI